MEQDKQHQQQHLRDLSQGVNLLLIATFSLNRTVQIWSRRPGSTGTWYFGWIIFVGLLIQAWYYQVNVQSSLKEDWVSSEALAGLSVLWFGIHGVVRSIRFAHGIRLHSYEPGEGILRGLMPHWSPTSVALASDLFVAIGLSLWLWLLSSPILCGWYASMCFWLLIGHLWINASQGRRRQAWIDSRVEADRWSQITKE